MGRKSRFKKFACSEYHQFVLGFTSCFLCYCAISLIDFVNTESLDSFNDNIAFQLRWAGPEWDMNALDKENSLVMTTEDKEKYVCVIPGLEREDKENVDNYQGPTAYRLLKPLFSKVTCTYRLEQFWTYELCHGHHLRQYHEESTLQGVYVQEFILGRFDADEYAEQEAKDPEKPLPTKKIGKKDKPYVELTMLGGSMCDLNGKPRKTKLLYFCDEGARNDLHSFKEISTCEYEAVILTPLLCLHPLYREKVIPINRIQCHAVDKSPTIPSKLSLLESEEKEYEILQQEEEDEDLPISPLPPPPPAPNSEKKVFPHDPKLVDDFLSGRQCLQGGTGWWKYEFCFGKKVEQYHEEYRQPRIAILLGKWNLEAHISWIKTNPQKKPTSKQVSHFYGDGSICDVTGHPRYIEVKLKCKVSSSKTNTVSMFLLETRTCKYTLTVESPIICPLLETVDEYGLFKKNLL